MAYRDDEDALQEYCPKCGKYTGGDDICPNCGVTIFDESGLEEVGEGDLEEEGVDPKDLPDDEEP